MYKTDSKKYGQIIYIGSTTSPLEKCYKYQESKVKRGYPNYPIKKYIRRNGGEEAFRIELFPM